MTKHRISGKEKRRMVWVHNSLLGRTIRAKKTCEVIIASPTTTEVAKYQAHLILSALDILWEELKFRDDTIFEEIKK